MAASDAGVEDAVVTLTGEDLIAGIPVSGSSIKIISSDKSALDDSLDSSCSSLVKNTTIANQLWDSDYYSGNLVATNKEYFAYAVRGKNGHMVRVIHSPTTSRALLKGLMAPVADLAFAPGSNDLLACLDKAGNLFVWDLETASNSVEHEVYFLLHAVDTGVEHLVHRLAWSPILLSQQRVEDDENPHLYLAVSHGKVAEVFDMDLVHAHRVDDKPLPREALGSGVVTIEEAHDGETMDISLSPDAGVLATCGSDGSVKFWQVDQGTASDPICLHEWVPHDGVAVSSVIFCDDRITKDANNPFWRFVVTGAEHNSVLKIWCTVNWVCLQTIRFTLPFVPGVGGSIFASSAPSLQLAIDPTASFLILSDTIRRVLYLLHLLPDANEGTSAVVCVSEYVLPQPVLSFCVIDINNAESSTEPAESSLALPSENVCIRLCCLQPKHVQELGVIVKPVAPVFRPAESDELPGESQEEIGTASTLPTMSEFDKSESSFLDSSALNMTSSLATSASLPELSDLVAPSTPASLAGEMDISAMAPVDTATLPSLFAPTATPPASFPGGDKLALLTPAAFESAETTDPILLPTVTNGHSSPQFVAGGAGSPALNMSQSLPSVTSLLPAVATTTAASFTSTQPPMPSGMGRFSGAMPGVGLPLRSLNPMSVFGVSPGQGPPPITAVPTTFMPSDRVKTRSPDSLDQVSSYAGVPSSSVGPLSLDMDTTSTPASVDNTDGQVAADVAQSSLPMSAAGNVDVDDGSGDEDVVIVGEVEVTTGSEVDSDGAAADDGQARASDVPSKPMVPVVEALPKHEEDPRVHDEAYLQAQLEKVLQETRDAGQKMYNPAPAQVEQSLDSTSNPPRAASPVQQASAQLMPKSSATLLVTGQPVQNLCDDGAESSGSVGAASEQAASNAVTSLLAVDSGNDENGQPQTQAKQRPRARSKRKSHTPQQDTPESAASEQAASNAVTSLLAVDSGNDENGQPQTQAKQRPRARSKRKSHTPQQDTPESDGIHRTDANLMDLIQWQAMELEQLKEQVREQKAASIDQTRVIKNLEAAVSHLTRTDQSNWEQLQKDRQADKQRQQALSNSVAMAVQSKVEKCIKSEVKTSFLPGVQSQLNGVPKQTRDSVISALNGQDGTLAVGIANAVRTKDVADAIGSTVASVNSAQVKQIWRRSFDEAFLPGVERSVGTLMEKVNTSLQQCSQEYVRQVQSIVLNCQQHSSKAADQLRPLVMELDKKCEVLAEQQRQASDALPRQVSSLMKPMLDETLKTLSDNLCRSVSQQVATELAVALPQVMAPTNQMLASQTAQLVTQQVQQQYATLSQQLTAQAQQQEGKLVQCVQAQERKVIECVQQGMQELAVQLRPAPTSNRAAPESHRATPEPPAQTTNSGPTRAQLQDSLQQYIVQGKYEQAFNAALTYSDIASVVYLCKIAPMDTIFAPGRCTVSQRIVLALIQQLAYDLGTQTEDKVKALVCTITAVDVNNAATSKFVPQVMQQVRGNVEAVSPSHPELASQLSLLKMAAQGMIR